MADYQDDKRQQIIDLLPDIFRRTLNDDADNPLVALIDVMAGLQAPSDMILGQLDVFFDPYRTPNRFVPYLAGWVDLAPLWIDEPDRLKAGEVPPFPSGMGRLRELIAAAAFLSQWRGTERGLLTFLEIATGISGFTIDQTVSGDDGQPIPFHIRVNIPAAAQPYMTLIDRVVRIEKPAYVTYDLNLMSAPSPDNPS